MTNLKRVKDILNYKGWKCSYHYRLDGTINYDRISAVPPDRDAALGGWFIVNRTDLYPRLNSSLFGSTPINDYVLQQAAVIKDVMRLTENKDD